jgi:hypothetical protein
MAPDPGQASSSSLSSYTTYTVSCALHRAVADPDHLAAIRDAVARVHDCTYHATDLLNLYVRDRLENHDGTGLENIFKQNWLLNAFQAVSVGTGRRAARIDVDVQAVFDAHMHGTFEPPVRTGLTQALVYECINLAAVGSTNVWMHFRKRVLSYARTAFALDEQTYQALDKNAKKARKLAIMQAAEDVCRAPTDPKRSSPQSYHAWVDATRDALGIDDAVGADWRGKPLLYHLKAKPHRFLRAMHVMSAAQHAAGRKPFALFPLRRAHVPRHVRFDKKVLDDLLGLGQLYAAAKAKKARGPDLNNSSATTSTGGGTTRAPKRKRDDPDLLAEKAAVFDRVLDLKRAGVHRRRHFAFAFTTDGVSLHLGMEKQMPMKQQQSSSSSSFPRRGVHSIDALKAALRSVHGGGDGGDNDNDDQEDGRDHHYDNTLHVIGIDPGKRELCVCVDADDPKAKKKDAPPVVRYTLAQRQRDLRTRQYADESKCMKPPSVADAEQQLSTFNSKAPSLNEFAQFSAMRRLLLGQHANEQKAFYADLAFRERRRKTRIKVQQSEARLVNRIRAMHTATYDPRRLVLAYGAWGLAAGRAGAACNRGTPPAIGVGLMRRLARDFVVAPTPEHYTSKTCVGCGGPCGAHPTLKTAKTNKEIRGLRVCKNEGCGLLQNRDRTGATNIGVQFRRLVRDEGPIRPMNAEELEFLRLATACVECDHDND